MNLPLKPGDGPYTPDSTGDLGWPDTTPPTRELAGLALLALLVRRRRAA